MLTANKSSKIGYGLEVDIWAAGVVLYSLIYGFLPFQTNDEQRTIENIKNGYLFCGEVASENCIDLI
jgi:serine/threonine protein kinase